VNRGISRCPKTMYQDATYRTKQRAAQCGSAQQDIPSRGCHARIATLTPILRRFFAEPARHGTFDCGNADIRRTSRCDIVKPSNYIIRRNRWASAPNWRELHITDTGCLYDLAVFDWSVSEYRHTSQAVTYCEKTIVPRASPKTPVGRGLVDQRRQTFTIRQGTKRCPSSEE